jgi:hypothetical protein
LYRFRFEDLSKCLFEITLVEALTLGIPYFGNSEFYDFEVESFAGSLTFTINDNSNIFYINRNHNSYTYGIWASIFKENSKLAFKEENFECDGGEFVVSLHKICIDFGACDGSMEIIWRRKADYHKIFSSHTAKEFSHIGTYV